MSGFGRFNLGPARPASDSYLSIASWPGAFDSCDDSREALLNPGPARRKQHNNRDRTPLQVLLIFQLGVCGHENLEALRLGSKNQVAILAAESRSEEHT